MPRNRVASRQNVSFQVSPWHVRTPAEESSQDPDTVVETQLVGTASDPSYIVDQHAGRSSRGDGAVSDHHGPAGQDPPDGLLEEDLHNSANGGTYATSAEGLSDVVILPSGLCVGFLIQQRTKACYTLRGSVILASMDCGRDEDSALLLMELHNSSNQRTLQLLTHKSGGDLWHLAPADDLSAQDCRLLQAKLPRLQLPHSSPQGSSSNAVFQAKLHLTSHQLLSDDAAEGHIQKYHPQCSGMCGVVNLGRWKLTGVPAGFLT